MPRVCVVFNPEAGARDAGSIAAALERDPVVDLRRVVDSRGTADLARSAADEGYEIVGAAGGDGTVGAVAAGLHRAGAGASLAVLPIGTGKLCVVTTPEGKAVPHPPGRQGTNIKPEWGCP